MNYDDLRYRLVELGAEKLAFLISKNKPKNDNVTHHYRGGFQALQQASFRLFNIDAARFRAQCMFEIRCLRLDVESERSDEN